MSDPKKTVWAPEHRGLKSAREVMQLMQNKLQADTEEQFARIDSLINLAIENQKISIWWNVDDLSEAVYQNVVKKLLEAGYGISNTGTNPVRISFYC